MRNHCWRYQDEGKDCAILLGKPSKASPSSDSAEVPKNGSCWAYPLIQNDYRQEKIIFELFSGALQENPVRAPGAITGGALTGQGPIQETIFGELFSGARQENPVIAPGQLHEKRFTELFW